MIERLKAGLRHVLVLLQHRHALSIIILLAIMLRLGVMLIWPQPPFSDGAYYVERATEIAAGKGYQEAGHATAFWPVGQPALIALGMRLTGPGITGILAINLIGAGTTIWLIAWFGENVAKNLAAGRLAALFYALYPAHIAYAGTPLSEVSSTALMMAATALLIGGRHQLRWLCLSGIVFGLVTLIRAQLLYFPIGVIIAMALLLHDFAWRKAVIATIATYLAMAAMILPWTLRNREMIGDFVLVSTNGGVALYTGAFDRATGDHVAWDKAMYERSGIPFEQRIARQVELDRIFMQRAKAWIYAHPAQYLGLMPKKAVTIWAKDSDGFWGLSAGYPAYQRLLTVIQWLDQFYYMGIILLALPALWIGLKAWLGKGARHDRELLFLFLMPGFVTLTAIIFTGQIRYHFPAMPFLCIATAWSLTRWARATPANG